jgi:osmotically-inducible protein OsmY
MILKANSSVRVTSNTFVTLMGTVMNDGEEKRALERWTEDTRPNFMLLYAALQS